VYSSFRKAGGGYFSVEDEERLKRDQSGEQSAARVREEQERE
jgi:hypothetical protein